MVAVMEKPKLDWWLMEMALVRVADVFADHDYQRGEKRGRVQKLVKGWDWERYAPIYVVARKGRYAVVDGQQRVLAAHELGIEELPAVIVVLPSQQAEAKFFLGANDASPVSALERFRARLMVEDEKAIRIQRQVEACGFTIGFTGGNKADAFTIKAVSALESLEDTGRIVPVLRTIRDTWGDQPHPNMVTKETLRGMGYALNHLQRNGVSREDLVAKLRGLTFKEMLDRAIRRRDSMAAKVDTTAALAAIVVEAYNYKRRNPVPPYGD